MIFQECLEIVLSVISDRKISENTIWHKHHIVPKHFGGDNSEQNIINLTSTEHSEVHRLLYEKYKYKQDWLAWQGLNGFLGKEDIIKESIKIGSSKAGKIAGQKSVDSGRIKEMSKKGILAMRNKFDNYDSYRLYMTEISKKQTGKSKEKLKDWYWITDGSQNIKIKNGTEIPDGFYKGRLKKWKTGYSNESKEKIECPHCGKLGGKPVMYRYHMNNCKKIKS